MMKLKKIYFTIFWGDFYNWELEQNHGSHCYSGSLDPMEIVLHTLCVSRQLTVAATVWKCCAFCFVQGHLGKQEQEQKWNSQCSSSSWMFKVIFHIYISVKLPKILPDEERVPQATLYFQDNLYWLFKPFSIENVHSNSHKLKVCHCPSSPYSNAFKKQTRNTE